MIKDAKYWFLDAVKYSRPEDVRRILDADPDLLDAIDVSGRSAVDLAVDLGKSEALRIMCDTIKKTPAGAAASGESPPPTPSRYLRVAAGFEYWTAAENDWLAENPEGSEKVWELRAAIVEVLCEPV